jgi:Cys-rich repeat protein
MKRTAMAAILLTAALTVGCSGSPEEVVKDPTTVECKGNDDCSTGKRCNSVGKCIDDSTSPNVDCKSNNDCSSGQKCNSVGKCIDEGTSTKECTLDSDCPSGKKCNSLNKCVEAGPVKCTWDADCAAGQKCNLLTGECESPSCQTHDECGKEEVCVDKACVKEVGNTCQVNDDCKAKTCVTLVGADYGYCSKSCKSWSECPSFWKCEILRNTTALYCIQ